ncbi:MAG: hypothetical protein ACRBFS_19535 [Aureispira sp.]
MAYTITNDSESLSIRHRDSNLIQAGKSIAAVIPKEATAFPRGGNNGTFIDFNAWGEPLMQINSEDVYLQDDPLGAVVLWTGTVDALLDKLNNEYLVSSASGGTNPPNPIDMTASVNIYTMADFPAPDTDGVITLKSGTTYNIIGVIAQGETSAKVTTAVDQSFYVESNVKIMGNSFFNTQLVSGGFSNLIGSGGSPTPFLSLVGNNEIENITIDGGGSDHNLIKIENNSSSNSIWNNVNFQNGGLLNSNNLGGIGVQLSIIGNLLATKCGFFNTGAFNMTGFLPAPSFDSIIFETCNFNYNLNLTSFLVFANTVTMNRRLVLRNCIGAIDSVNGGLVNYSIIDTKAQRESFIISGCKINMINGNPLTSFTGVTEDSPQVLFENNQIQGLSNTYVGVSAKTIFSSGQYPTTILTQNAYSPIVADASGGLTSGFDHQQNSSRLWDVVVIAGASYFRYVGAQERTFLIHNNLTASSGNNRILNTRAMRGEMDDNGVITNTPSNPIAIIEQSVGNKATSNGSGRPEAISSDFIAAFSYGDFFYMEVANFSNGDDIEAQAFSVFTSKVA